MKERGITASEMAARLDVTKQAVSQWRDRYGPGMPTLRRACQELGVSVDEVLDWCDEHGPDGKSPTPDPAEAG